MCARSSGRVTNTTAYGANVAVFVAGGRCYVLSPTGSVQRTYTFAPGSVQEFALAGVGLVAQLHGGRVEIRNGTAVRSLTLPAGARMLDYAEGILLYKVGPQIRARRVSTGKDSRLRTATFAVLEHNGLTYALGRRIEPFDMPTIRAIVRDAGKNGDRLSSYIKGVAKSAAFRMSRVEAVETTEAEVAGK